MSTLVYWDHTGMMHANSKKSQQECLRMAVSICQCFNSPQRFRLGHRGTYITVYPDSNVAELIKNYNIPDHSVRTLDL